MFFTILGCWVGGGGGSQFGIGGGSPKGLVHNLLMRFFTLDSSKIEVFKTFFFMFQAIFGCFSPYWGVGWGWGV